MLYEAYQMRLSEKLELNIQTSNQGYRDVLDVVEAHSFNVEAGLAKVVCWPISVKSVVQQGTWSN